MLGLVYDCPPPRDVPAFIAFVEAMEPLERRLRLLKKLSQGCYTLQELADEFDVAKTTLHHHLVTLRSVGLVRVRMSDNRYCLRREMLNDLDELLNRYLA
jgi:DNA-binding IclR family transcriptional regulator